MLGTTPKGFWETSGFDRESMRQYIRAVHGEDKDGRVFIVWADKSKTGAWHQRGYKWPDLLSHLRKITDSTKRNRYVTLNAYHSPLRRAETLFRINAIGFDIDFHENAISADAIIESFWRFSENVFQKNILPPPSIAVFTGRGLQLIYILDSLPKQGVPLWRMVGEAMAKRIEAGLLLDLGVAAGAGKLDGNYGDVTRVMRVPGTYNTSADCYTSIIRQDGQQLDAASTVYRLDELRDAFLPELIPNPRRTNDQRETKSDGKLLRIFNAHSLHWARWHDLLRLRELRREQEQPEDYRRRMVFLYRYWVCFCVGLETALQAAQEFNQGFLNPLPRKVVELDTLSAEKAYSLWLVDKKKGYNYRNSTLIEFLGITPEEQRHLETIIGKEEKQRRQKEKNWYHEKRDEERRQQNQEQEMEIMRLLEAGYSYTAIGEKMGLSRKTISKMVKKL